MHSLKDIFIKDVNVLLHHYIPCSTIEGLHGYHRRKELLNLFGLFPCEKFHGQFQHTKTISEFAVDSISKILLGKDTVVNLAGIKCILLLWTEAQSSIQRHYAMVHHYQSWQVAPQWPFQLSQKGTLDQALLYNLQNCFEILLVNNLNRNHM